MVEVFGPERQLSERYALKAAFDTMQQGCGFLEFPPTRSDMRPIPFRHGQLSFQSESIALATATEFVRAFVEQLTHDGTAELTLQIDPIPRINRWQIDAREWIAQPLLDECNPDAARLRRELSIQLQRSTTLRNRPLRTARVPSVGRAMTHRDYIVVGALTGTRLTLSGLHHALPTLSMEACTEIVLRHLLFGNLYFEQPTGRVGLAAASPSATTQPSRQEAQKSGSWLGRLRTKLTSLASS